MSDTKFDPKKFKEFKFNAQASLVNTLKPKERPPIIKSAYPSAKTAKQPAIKSPFSSIFFLIKLFIFGFVLAIFIKALIIQPFVMPTNDMQPRLHAGDIILSNKLSYGYSRPLWKMLSMSVQIPSTPDRMDIVVYECDKEPGYCIKRVVGLPGEQIKTRKGIIYINGKPFKGKKNKWNKIADLGPIRLTSQSYFVIGDNKNTSDFSLVPRRKMVGTAVVKVWPAKDLRVIR